MTLKIDDVLLKTYPGLQVIELEINNLRIAEENEELEAFKKAAQQRVREKFSSLDEVRNQPVFRAYRDFFWRVGIDPTKSRPAAEALTRKILGGRDLPTINTLVDSYNLASVVTAVAIAAFDLDRISRPDLLMRLAGKAEQFKGIGMDVPINLQGVEVVIEDTKSKDLIAVYPYRDSDDTKVTPGTTSVLLLMCGVPGVSIELLGEAENLSKEYVEMYCI